MRNVRVYLLECIRLHQGVCLHVSMPASECVHAHDTFKHPKAYPQFPHLSLDSLSYTCRDHSPRAFKPSHDDIKPSVIFHRPVYRDEPAVDSLLRMCAVSAKLFA